MLLAWKLLNGLLEKPSVLLADLINSPVDEEQERDILYNVKEFKNLVKL